MTRNLTTQGFHGDEPSSIHPNGRRCGVRVGACGRSVELELFETPELDSRLSIPVPVQRAGWGGSKPPTRTRPWVCSSGIFGRLPPAPAACARVLRVSAEVMTPKTRQDPYYWDSYKTYFFGAFLVEARRIGPARKSAAIRHWYCECGSPTS